MRSLELCVLIVAFAALSSSSPAPDNSVDDQKVFKDFCEKFDKKYSSDAEEKAAMQNVLQAVKEIEEHNKLYEQGKKSYKQGLTQHSDLSDEEWEALLGYEEEDETEFRSKRAADNKNEFPEGPESVDWREKGLVGPVHDQKRCGSCWAFSTIEVVAAVWRKNNKTNVPSPQQLIDCHHEHAHGCHGGGPTTALKYVKEHGLTDEKNYPYKHTQGKCEYKESDKVGDIKNIHLRIPNGDEKYMKNIIAAVGPVSIALCFHKELKHFHGGFYENDNCCKKNNHAPILVGYGTDAKHGDYWILKNSFGTNWGDGGYLKMARNKGNMCNIAHKATWAE